MNQQLATASETGMASTGMGGQMTVFFDALPTESGQKDDGTPCVSRPLVLLFGLKVCSDAVWDGGGYRSVDILQVDVR